jgi:hypothetical protein
LDDNNGVKCDSERIGWPADKRAIRGAFPLRHLHGPANGAAMPELDFITQESLTGSWSVDNANDTVSVAMRTWATMAWPNSEQQRNDFLVTLGAISVGRLAELPSPANRQQAMAFEQSRAAIIAAMQEHWMAPFGGYTGVANAPGWRTLVDQSGNQALQKWEPTAWIMFYLLTMQRSHSSELRGGASIEKAIYLFTRFHAVRQGSNNRADIMAAWSEMKPVAHLCCALLLLWIEAKQSSPDARLSEAIDAYFERFPRFLSLARIVQSFGLSFQAHSQRTPLFVHDAVWMIPKRLGLPKIELNFERLPDDYIAALRNDYSRDRPR